MKIRIILASILAIILVSGVYSVKDTNKSVNATTDTAAIVTSNKAVESDPLDRESEDRLIEDLAKKKEAEKPTEKATENSVEKAVKQSAEKVTEKVTEKLTEKAEKPTETAAEKVTEKVTEKPTTTQSAIKTIFNCGTLDGSYSATNYEMAIFNAINAKRIENGLSSVSYNGNIHTLAKIRADEQNSVQGHTRPNGNKPSSVFSDRGISYSYFGEIIGCNFREETDEDVGLLIQMWMDSPGHRAAILNESYTFAAVAATPAGDGYMHIVCLFYAD